MYIYVCVCVLCVCQGLWKGVCYLYLCARAPQSQACRSSQDNPSASNTPLGIMGKCAQITAYGKKGKACAVPKAKANALKVKSVEPSLGALATPFRNLMAFRCSERCKKAANNVEPCFL